VVVEPVVEGSRSVLWEGIDVEVIDAGVNGIGSRARGLGSILRRIQSGYIRSYAAWSARRGKRAGGAGIAGVRK